MRTLTSSCLLLVAIVAAGCGDNIKPGVFVDTAVASSILQAGDQVGARCALVDEFGETALDDAGNPLADKTDFTISYEAPESFGTDAGGQPIAVRAGSAVVRCAAPSLGLVDASPIHLSIEPGPPARVVTHLDSPTTTAGTPDGVSCLVFDAYGNPVPHAALPGEIEPAAISPSGAGTSSTLTSVTATTAGDYTVSCLVMGATDVESAPLLVMPALPASITGILDPERTIYAILDQVTLIASTFDRYGNRVDDVHYAYETSPTVPSPAPARYKFAADGLYEMTARVTSMTDQDIPLAVTLPALVDSTGLRIDCQRIDQPNVSSPAYMLTAGPSTVNVPVHLDGAFTAASVTINGTAATFDAASGNYRAAVPLGFGMNFFDVIATDTHGVQNSTTCYVLAAGYYSPETQILDGSVALRLDQYAFGDPDPTGLDSLNDLFWTVLSSGALRTLVDTALQQANPINDGSCGFFACNPDVNYRANTLGWDTPTTALTLESGGFHAHVHLPNVHLVVSACGTFCCPGGSDITVRASAIDADVDFGLSLSGGRVRTALVGTPAVNVGNVTLDGSGFCGFVINLVQSFFTGTVKNAVQSSLQKFINQNVGPMLDGITSSLDVSTLGQQFTVPRLDGTGSVTLGFGLAFSSLDITTARALIGLGTKFSPAATTMTRASLGIPRRTANALLDPPGTSNARPVGLSAYEGVLNEVTHSLWRGGFFQATLNLGGGTATIDSWLPPVAVIGAGNTAELELGGVAATLTIPGVIDNPINIMFGGHANATVSLAGNALHFGGLSIDKLYVSFQVTLSQSQRNAMESFLTSALQDVLASALNNGLPALPIPSFTLPASVSTYGLPAGAQMGILNPVLSTQSPHAVLDGQFGVH